MSTGSPEGKEAYTPLTEKASLIRSVGKKMIEPREISGKNIFGFLRATAIRLNAYAHLDNSISHLSEKCKYFLLSIVLR